MTPSEQAQVEAALKTAYEKGWRDARYYPHRRLPALHVDWGEHPHLSALWPQDEATWGPPQAAASRIDGRAP